MVRGLSVRRQDIPSPPIKHKPNKDATDLFYKKTKLYFKNHISRKNRNARELN
jgi:hypothetical protein